MAQVKFEREEHYVLEKLVQRFVETANKGIAASVRRNPRGPLKSLQIEHVSFGNNPPYLEITRVRSAAEFPPGLVPKADDRPTAKQLTVEVESGGVTGCHVRTLKGREVTFADVAKTLPLANVKPPARPSPRRRRRRPQSPRMASDSLASSEGQTDEGDYGEEMEECEEHEEIDEDEPGAPEATPDQSQASYLSVQDADAFPRPTPDPSDFDDDDDDEDDEGDDYVCPGFLEALSQHVMKLVPQELTKLLGPDGAWIEAKLSYAGDFELQLATVLGKDLVLGDERPLKSFVSLPITCRVHSLRLDTSIELLLQDQHLTVYAIPETPYNDWDSCFSVSVDISFAGKAYPESSERVSELVSTVLSEALVDHCLWPNSLRIPLHELDASVHKIMSQWVMRRAAAR
eukprot:TRINITY_DN11055_c0_g2_i1.p1 TRINITY_DN11055_c0_g2~~TRINITY_DN11055_c0_g2_i1.p1  ORF type:complete len:402 (+),score=86.09 TRINITY_DN11055_c0_g2_i1:228-1433(+)